MKIFLNILTALLLATPSIQAEETESQRENTRPKIIFEHKHEKKYDCTARIETLRFLAPLMSREFKAELSESYAVILKAIEEAQASSDSTTWHTSVKAKGVTSEIDFKENGRMDIRMELKRAYLTLYNITMKDLKKIYEKYLGVNSVSNNS